MRLISTDTLTIEIFESSEVPPYSILSHTWGPEEITFQDWLYAHNQVPPRWGWVQLEDEVAKLKAKAGYRKLLEACEVVRRDGFAWLWADTVCIDKTSSAELSEAINSMYRWYRDAWQCYVYLEDIKSAAGSTRAETLGRVRGSRWFTRGWTLQELLAPHWLLFYTTDWHLLGEIGSENGTEDLVSLVAEVTSIPTSCILDEQEIARRSVAERMSWASRRRTTRSEDAAYSLLGLFDVHMPLLYGEGAERAFSRLQQEVIARTRDQSFLAWTSCPGAWFPTDSAYAACPQTGALAAGPASFAGAALSRLLPPDYTSPGRGSGAGRGGFGGRRSGRFERGFREGRLTVTNLGLFATMELIPTVHGRFFFAAVACAWSEPERTIEGHGFAFEVSRPREVWIPLLRLVEGRYCRIPLPAFTITVADCFVSEARQAALRPEICLTMHPGDGTGLTTVMRRDGDGPRVAVVLAFPGGAGMSVLASSTVSRLSEPCVVELETHSTLPYAHAVVILGAPRSSSDARGGGENSLFFQPELRPGQVALFFLVSLAPDSAADTGDTRGGDEVTAFKTSVVAQGRCHCKMLPLDELANDLRAEGEMRLESFLGQEQGSESEPWLTKGGLGDMSVRMSSDRWTLPGNNFFFMAQISRMGGGDSP